jgi:hypothetical protein
MVQLVYHVTTMDEQGRRGGRAFPVRQSLNMTRNPPLQSLPVFLDLSRLSSSSIKSASSHILSHLWATLGALDCSQQELILWPQLMQIGVVSINAGPFLQWH